MADARLMGVSMGGIQNQRALEVDVDANDGEGELRLRLSADPQFNRVQGFRFDHNPLRYTLKVVAGLRLGHPKFTSASATDETKDDDSQIANLFFLGCSCLGSVEEQSIQQLLDQPGMHSSLSTVWLFHSELQHLYFKDTSSASQALEILASHPPGQHLLSRLYFGGWVEDSTAGPKYAWDNFDGLLDPRAFLSCGFGRISMNAFYHVLFVLLVCHSLANGSINEFQPMDSLLLLFFLGQVVEEGKEFWTSPRYLRKFWNMLDMIVIVSLMMYFCFMSYEHVARTALTTCCLFLLIRLLGALRNTAVLDLGMLVRTTVAMLGSIMSFMLMYLFVIGAFAVAFYFVFSLEASMTEETVGEGAERRLAHPRGGAPKRSKPVVEANPVFAHFWPLCLWLFNASLGDFHFEDFAHSEFRLAGVAMLLLFLMVCTITLLNFMIAILSATYEEQQSASRELYVLDLGHDALEMPYRPSLGKPPWMPRPINVLNMAVFTLFAALKAPLGSHSPWVERLDSCRWELQMMILWLFGNLLMVVAVLIVFIIALFFMVFLLIGTAPVTGLTLAANVLNGEMSSAWEGYCEASNVNEGRSRLSCRTFYGFVLSLPFNQMICFASLVVVMWGSIVYILVAKFKDKHIVSYVLTSHEWLDDKLICAVWGLSVEDKPIWLQAFFPTLWSLYGLGVVWTLTNFLAPIMCRLLCSSADGSVSPMQVGWKALRKEAKSKYEAERAAVAEFIPAEVQGPYSAFASDETSDRTARVAQFEISESESDDNVMRAIESMPARDRRRRLSKKVTLKKNVDMLGELRSRFGSAQSRSYASLDGGGVDDEGYLLMNASSMLEALVQADCRRLVLQGLDLIYKADRIPKYPLHFFAVYIDLDDWYWLVCSILWCQKLQRPFLAMIPEDRRRHVSRHQRAALASHPVFGNYCFTPEGVDSPEQGVFVEDWVHAIHDGTMHLRRIRTLSILSCLEQYASRLLVEIQEQEQQELTKRQKARRPSLR